jgi:DNA phosphorothioation-associated putative methyltransferase
VERVTGVACVSPVPGVVYAFKDEALRLRFLARRLTPDTSWLESQDAAGALRAVVHFLEQRGRHPRLEETPEHMLALLRHLRPAELNRLVAAAANPTRIEQGQQRTTMNTLLFLAVELFNGRGPFRSLPLTVQYDVRAFFQSYREACHRADRLLLKLRDDAYVVAAMRRSIGKLTPTALYVHRRAADLMPVVLRIYQHCGGVAAGPPPDWTLIKLHHDRRMVSWLSYPEFDADPHPRLARSYSVDLRSLESRYRDYSNSENRPLLHRKEEFVSPDDPEAPKYRRLTQSELRAGLYRNPEVIGTETGWRAELERCGVHLRGHRLLRNQSNR